MGFGDWTSRALVEEVFPTINALHSRISQEHGILTSSSPIDYAKYPIGTKLFLRPNHSCMTAAEYPIYYAVNSNMDILGTWTPAKYWN